MTGEQKLATAGHLGPIVAKFTTSTWPRHAEGHAHQNMHCTAMRSCTTSDTHSPIKHELTKVHTTSRQYSKVMPQW
eukprot:1343697-Amphidinium_carterae.3